MFEGKGTLMSSESTDPESMPDAGKIDLLMRLLPKDDGCTPHRESDYCAGQEESRVFPKSRLTPRRLCGLVLSGRLSKNAPKKK